VLVLYWIKPWCGAGLGLWTLFRVLINIFKKNEVKITYRDAVLALGSEPSEGLGLSDVAGPFESFGKKFSNPLGTLPSAWRKIAISNLLSPLTLVTVLHRLVPFHLLELLYHIVYYILQCSSFPLTLVALLHSLLNTFITSLPEKGWRLAAESTYFSCCIAYFTT